MPGINSTGTPNVNDYNLGRGIVYLSILDANGFPVEYRDVGNAPEFVISAATNVIDHKSSRAGLAVIDKELVVSVDMKVKLVLDEINFENLSAFFNGTEGTKSNAASVAGVVPDAAGNVFVIDQGRWYDLYDTTKGLAGITTDVNSHRVYDIKKTGFTVKTTGDVALTEGTDFLVDYVMGRIFSIKGGAMTGSASPGTGYKVTIPANGAAVTTVDQVQGLTTIGKTFGLKFISADPAFEDFETEYQFHQVNLRPQGDFSLIGDKVTEVTLEGVVQLNSNADPNSPYVTIRTHAHAHD